MIEVEIKLSITDSNEIEENLRALGFEKSKLLKEKDIYFDNRERQITNTDGALRVRSCENELTHEKNSYLTYKGPKLDSISMTRKELEVEISSPENVKEILEELGYVLTFPVVKCRQYFFRDKITACVDQVEGLGSFLELEIVVESELEKPEALEQLLGLVEKLGYCRKNLVRSSYLSMLQYKRNLWEKISTAIKVLPDNKNDFEILVKGLCTDENITRFLLDKTIGATNDQRMVVAMNVLLEHGGRELLRKDHGFKINLMKKAQMHENQFVVIYEDWTAAEAFLDVYNLLENV